MNFFQLIQNLIATPEPGKAPAKISSKLTREDEERWKQMLLKASEGDKIVYEQLLAEMYEYLLLFCRRHLYSPEMLEDCVQESLLAIHKAKHTFDMAKPFGPWFFTIVRHKIIDQYRKNKRQNERESLGPDYEQVVSSSAFGFDFAEEIRNLLPKLNPLYREIFELTKLDNKPISEVAKLLNISESAVKVRAHRGSKALRKLIELEFAKKY